MHVTKKKNICNEKTTSKVMKVFDFPYLCICSLCVSYLSPPFFLSGAPIIMMTYCKRHIIAVSSLDRKTSGNPTPSKPAISMAYPSRSPHSWKVVARWKLGRSNGLSPNR